MAALKPIYYFSNKSTHDFADITDHVSLMVSTPYAYSLAYKVGEAEAKYSEPRGVAFDTSGNMFVADSANHSIRQIVISTGVVTTLAGGVSGFTDATGVDAMFNYPTDIVVDTNGNLFVADANNNSIRQIVISTGVVTTLAGS